MIRKLKIEFKGFIIDRNMENSKKAQPIFLKFFGYAHVWFVPL
jgi:hypothetical protein